MHTCTCIHTCIEAVPLVVAPIHVDKLSPFQFYFLCICCVYKFTCIKLLLYIIPGAHEQKEHPTPNRCNRTVFYQMKIKSTQQVQVVLPYMEGAVTTAKWKVYNSVMNSRCKLM